MLILFFHQNTKIPYVKEKKYKGKLTNTEFIKVTRPPNGKCPPFQADNLFLIMFKLVPKYQLHVTYGTRYFLKYLYIYLLI